MDVRLFEKSTHACGLCKKIFDRRDLRDRHKRRCVRTFSNPRKSRQKSCASCAASKLSCDQRVPSCSRCSRRRLQCEYVSQSERVVQEKTADYSPSLADSLSADQTSGSEEGRMAFMQNDAVRPTGSDRRVDGVITQSGQPDVISINDADVVSGSNFEAPQMNWSFEESLDHDSELPIDLPQSNPEALPGWDQAANFPSAMPLNGAELFQSAYDEPWPDNNSAGFEPLVRHYWDNGNLTDSAIDPANNATFDLLGSFGIPGSRNSTTSFGNMSFPGSAIFNTLSWKPPLSFDGGDPINTALEDQPSSLIRLNDTRATALEVVDISKQLEWRPTISQPTFPHVGTRPIPSPSTIPLTPETDADLIKILCGYPQMMLQSGGNYPPFVHHKIYGCEKGDVLKPLANAFCCVSALNAALPSGEAFVHALLTAERERLVRSFVRNLFPSTHPNPALCAQSLSLPPRGTERTLTLLASQSLLKSSETDTLAVIHAMCVYQILGFFSASNATAARAAALQQPFFLKMARALTTSHLPHILSPAAIPPPTTAESSWRRWIIAETVRRTFFLVHAINTLSCRAGTQDPFFFESLDDDVLTNIPLPAPDKVWKADTAVEWAEALERERRGDTIGGVVRAGSWEDGGGAMQEFTRLVLMCADSKSGNRG